jgi:hypothetical protein
MDRPHPIHVVTLTLVGLATIFAFIAMRVAFDARDAARSAASNSFDNASGEVRTLQDALIRAGVIDDPWFIPDDRGEVDGPWARCLTVAERAAMGAMGDDAPLPDPPCDSIAIDDVTCEVPETDPSDDGVEPDTCGLEVLVDGRHHYLSGEARPDDVDADGTAFFNVTGTPGIDRYVRGEGDSGYVHLVGFHDRHGWYAIHLMDW